MWITKIRLINVRGFEKAEMKKALLIRLVDWCDKNPDAARESFSKSAFEVIEILKEIHYSFNNNAK